MIKSEPIWIEPQVTAQELKRLYKQEVKGIYNEQLEDRIISGFIIVLEDIVRWIDESIQEFSTLTQILNKKEQTLELINILQSAKSPEEKMIAIDQVLNTAHRSGFYGYYLVKDTHTTFENFVEELRNLKISSLNMRKKSFIMYNDKGQKFEVKI
jgi:hypothetical protein